MKGNSYEKYVTRFRASALLKIATATPNTSGVSLAVVSGG
jgi:hypothetical protein